MALSAVRQVLFNAAERSSLFSVARRLPDRVISRNIAVGLCSTQQELRVRPAAEGRLKEIVRSTKNDGKTITVEGVVKRNDDEGTVLDLPKEACPLCSLDMEIHYTDVLIVSQFVNKSGQMLPRRVTGLCAKQQRKMATLVHKAQNAGLLTSLRPPLKDGRERKPDKDSYFKFKGFNRYFTEDY